MFPRPGDCFMDGKWLISFLFGDLGTGMIQSLFWNWGLKVEMRDKGFSFVFGYSFHSFPWDYFLLFYYFIFIDYLLNILFVFDLFWFSSTKVRDLSRDHQKWRNSNHGWNTTSSIPTQSIPSKISGVAHLLLASNMVKRVPADSRSEYRLWRIPRYPLCIHTCGHIYNGFSILKACSSTLLGRIPYRSASRR